jgi:hypothetical protein
MSKKACMSTIVCAMTSMKMLTFLITVKSFAKILYHHKLIINEKMLLFKLLIVPLVSPVIIEDFVDTTSSCPNRLIAM